jgi:hypothetical protein
MRILLTFPAVLAACGPGSTGEPCDCDGHGVQLCDGEDCGPCMCLALLPASEDPEPSATFHVDPDVEHGDGSAERPWTQLDWDALDDALAEGHVRVLFSALEADGASPETWPERLDLTRGDTSEHRLVLEGHAQYNRDDGDPSWAEAPNGARARVPGITTGYEDVERSHITVRGFEVTGSRDKGIRFQAGDEVIIEDNLVHDNRGSPSISLGYTSRTGHASSSFTVRNNHVWDQRGECVYIGGAGGEDIDAHQRVVVENNLIHDCWVALGTEHDGINIKDRIGEVLVQRNVVFHTDWGIEASSPGLYAHNLVWGTARNGFHFSDGWGSGLNGLQLRDNVSVDAGQAGLYLNASRNPTEGVLIEGFTAVGAAEAGLELGTEAGLTARLAELWLEGNAVGLDAWGGVEAEVESCVAADNELDADRDMAAATCTPGSSRLAPLETMAGPDGVFFTQDDPWLAPEGGAQLPEDQPACLTAASSPAGKARIR